MTLSPTAGPSRSVAFALVMSGGSIPCRRDSRNVKSPEIVGTFFEEFGAFVVPVFWSA